MAIDLASKLKLGANNSINKFEFRKISMAKPDNIIESLRLFVVWMLKSNILALKDPGMLSVVLI